MSKTVTVTGPKSFARAVLLGLGVPVTTSNIWILTGWEAQEGGNWRNTAKYNPLGTTLPVGNSYSAGADQGTIQSYTSWQNGVTATVSMLNQSNMAGIKAALAKGNDPEGVAAAVVASPWGTKTIFSIPQGKAYHREYANTTKGVVDISAVQAGQPGGSPSATTGAGASSGSGAQGAGLSLKDLNPWDDIKGLVNAGKTAVAEQESIADFLGKLLDPSFWQRIGVGVVGVGLVAVGFDLMKDGIGSSSSPSKGGAAGAAGGSLGAAKGAAEGATTEGSGVAAKAAEAGALA